MSNRGPSKAKKDPKALAPIGSSVVAAIGRLLASFVPRKETLLKRMIQIVTSVLAAFGGFLTRSAPPDEVAPGFAVGVAAFLALCVLLVVAAISKNLPRRRFKRRWLAVAGLGFVSSLFLGSFYFAALDTYTFRYPDPTSPSYVAGTELTPNAQAHAKANPSRASKTLLVGDLQALEDRSKVWTTASIAHARVLLLAEYLGLVLSLVTTLFCVTEGVLQPL